MSFFKTNARKLFFRGSRKVIDTTSVIIEKNPEIDSIAKVLAKRIERYFGLGQSFIYFHLIWFGIMLGFAVMSTIIAIGKFIVSIEVDYFISNRDLIFNFGYASFFICIIIGFISHYKSQHHAIRIKKAKEDLDKEFKSKNDELERKYTERMHQLEARFLEEEERFLALQRDNEAEQSDSSMWDNLPSLGIKRKKQKSLNDLSDNNLSLVKKDDVNDKIIPKNKKISKWYKLRKK